ncbi:MAG TPA: HEXXH motif-containing putative peptide modification protein [Pseudobdellovibrionaceae bacterium]|nr:HEXXH motif-containing putative peptide modification protein [Pseudobdellovibrionaceae bacterium]
MIYTTGFKQNIENIATLALSVDPKLNLKSMDDLKKGYNYYISCNQPNSLLRDNHQTYIENIENISEKKTLAAQFSNDSNLNDLNQNNLIENIEYPYSQNIKKNIENALNFLEKKAPQTKILFDLVFNYYFLAHSSRAGGGTSSGALGVLWLNPKESWTVQDYTEVMVHELTHQLLFIDERRYRHYINIEDLVKKESYAYSTILNRQRPLDKVTHSYFVALNVLKYRELNFKNGKPIVHPESKKIENSLKETINSLNTYHYSLMSDRLSKLLKMKESKYETIAVG